MGGRDGALLVVGAAQPWPGELPASDPLARLREPWPPSPTRWCPGCRCKVETPLQEGECECCTTVTLAVTPQRNPSKGEHGPRRQQWEAQKWVPLQACKEGLNVVDHKKTVLHRHTESNQRTDLAGSYKQNKITNHYTIRSSPYCAFK